MVLVPTPAGVWAARCVRWTGVGLVRPFGGRKPHTGKGKISGGLPRYKPDSYASFFGLFCILRVDGVSARK